MNNSDTLVRQKTTSVIVEKPQDSLWFSATGGLGIHCIYNPVGLFCGIIFSGFGNFIQEVYLSSSYCTLNGKPHTLLGGTYLIKTIYFLQQQKEDLVFDVQVDVKKEYEQQYVRPSSYYELQKDFSWIKAEESRYYKGDFHAHTFFSDGKNTLEEADLLVKEQELEFICFTEHNGMSFFSGNTFLSEEEKEKEKGCLYVPSFELTLGLGHFNIHGVEEIKFPWERKIESEEAENIDIALTEAELLEGMLSLYQQKGNLSLNHMFMEPWQLRYDQLDLSRLNTIEIICDPTYFSAKEVNEKAIQFLDFLWSEGIFLFGVGGSDSHNKKGECYEYSNLPSVYGDPATYVYCNGLSVNNVVEGVKRGHSYISRVGALELLLEDQKETILPGEQLKLSLDQKNHIFNYTVGVTATTLASFRGKLFGRWFLLGKLVKEVEYTREETSHTFSFCVDTYHDYGWIRFALYDDTNQVQAYVNPNFWGEKKPKTTKFKDLYLHFTKDKPTIKGVLFDKDGTLIEFHHIWYPVIGQVFLRLKDQFKVSEATIEQMKKDCGYETYGFAKESKIQYLPTSEIVKSWLKWMSLSKELNHTNREITGELLTQMIEEEASKEDLIIPTIVGVLELLSTLKEKGYRLGVATADTVIPTKYSLEKAGILPFFDYVGCNEKGVRPKPDQQMGLAFCEQVKLKPEEILVVGDSISDMEFANNLGAQFVGIRTEYNHYEKFLMENKQVVSSIIDILTCFAL